MDFQTHYSGNIVIEGNFTGTIAIGTVGTRLRNMTGTITIGTVLAPANLSVPGRIAIAGDASNLDDPPIWIQGSITGTGASAPMIYVGDQVFGTIAVNGSLANTDSSGPEIEIANGTWGTAGAVAINFDGASAAADDWASGAGVKLGSTTYTSNNPANRIWNVSHCKGDFNGDRAVNSSDGTPFNDYNNNNATYLSNYPGLKGSAIYHADGDFDNAWTAPPSTDNYRIMSLIDTGCDCVAEEPASNCPGDPTDNFVVDISDLTIPLSHFGQSSGQGPEDGDTDSDGDIDLSDLAALLSRFGTELCPLDCDGAPATGSVTIGVSGFDTGTYVSGEFKGEIADFVFDVLVTINDSSDDWVASGVEVTTANGAALLLVPSAGNPPVPGSSVPDKYATFFSVPYSVNANSRFNTPFPSGGIAGEYDPGASGYTYTSSAIDASWYDLNSTSNDGPAAVFRVVIDVSGVSGADTSGGFGSVYFTTGTPGSGDIKVADMTFEVEHKYDDSGATTVSGSFYVTD